MPERKSNKSMHEDRFNEDNVNEASGSFSSFDDDDDIFASDYTITDDDDRARGKHARHARQETSDEEAQGADAGADASDASDASDDALSDSDESTQAESDSQGDDTTDAEKQSESDEEMPQYMRRSRRTRRILIVVIIILVVLLAAGFGLSYFFFETSQEETAEQVQDNEEANVIEDESAAEDLSTETAKTTSAPNLVSLLGLTLDEALNELQHGAQVTTTQEVNEENNPIKSESRVILTTEITGDTTSGIPTVYLGFNADNHVIQAGYSVATASLGYGSLSFSDAVLNEKIIENTFEEAGVTLSDGAVVLPEDKSTYSTYDSDGTTLVREYYSFSGNVDISGTTYEWSAVLSYDYATANATGNLSDTIRMIYVYLSA